VIDVRGRAGSASSLAGLPGCIARVARSLAVLFCPELPLFSLAGGGTGSLLRSGIGGGLDCRLSGSRGLAFLLALCRFGLFARAAGGGSLFCFGSLAGLAAGSTRCHKRFVDRRTGKEFCKGSASRVGCGRLPLLESGSRPWQTDSSTNCESSCGPLGSLFTSTLNLASRVEDYQPPAIVIS